jgi:glycosyltransferase involved in cell wall biosynthesis
MDLTILICTHNSGSKIAKTLMHIREQRKTENILWEVLIVDYISSDETLSIAKKIFKDSVIKLRIIHETKQGKTPALETGLYAALGDFICIVDDDNWISENYVAIAHQIMINHDDVGVIGAFGIPHCEIEPPLWFNDYQGIFAVGGQGKHSGYVENKNRMWFWGAGSVFRKEAWLKAKTNGFTPIFNPTRSKDSIYLTKGFTGGEDPEMCYAVQLSGYRLWYEPTLQYTHFIPRLRLTKEFVINAMQGAAKATPILRIYMTESTPNSKLGFTRKILYENWILHLLIILYKYIILQSKVQLGNDSDKSFAFTKNRKVYLAQINTLWELRISYSNIVKSIRKLKNGIPS